MPVDPTILVRPPAPTLEQGELTHLARSAVDPELARTQWEGYVDAFARRGWKVVSLAPADEYPDGVFVEDTVVMFDHLAVLTSPGAESRRGEVVSTQRGLERLNAQGAGIEIAEITGSGRLEGGDVLKVGDVVYVGRTARTNAEGVRQLAALVEPLGRRVQEVPVSRVLHLKSAVTALPDGTVIGFGPLVEDRQRFADFVAVPEEHGIAVVDLGDGAVLMSADAPETAKLLSARGLDVVRVGISEFEKLEGCVTCLSVRLRGR